MSLPAVDTPTPLTPPLSAPSFYSPARSRTSPALPSDPQQKPSISPSIAPLHAFDLASQSKAPLSPPVLLDAHAAHPPSQPHATPRSSTAAALAKPATSAHQAHGAHSRRREAVATPQPHESIHSNLDPASMFQLRSDPQNELSIQRKPQDREPSLMRNARMDQEEAIQQAAAQLHQQQHPQSQSQSEQQQRQNSLLLQHYQERDALVADAFRAARQSGHLEWIILMELSRFASQHHLSPYSIMKFGPRGSPFAYVPITLQRPDVVHQTMHQQRESERRAIEWILNKKRLRSLEMQQRQHQPQRQQHQQRQQRERPSGIVTESCQQDASQGVLSGSIVGTKRSASVITPPIARATSLLRTSSSGGPGVAVEDQISQAMSDSIAGTLQCSGGGGASASRALPSPSSAESQSVDDGEAKRIHEINQSTRKVALGQDAPATVPPAAQAGSNVYVDGPLSNQEIYVQDIEKASPTQKPGHPGGFGDGGSCEAAQAMAPLIASMPAVQQAQLAMKTSDTHPIHISPIVPENLLQEISDTILAQTPPEFLGDFDDDEDHDDQDDGGKSDRSELHLPVPSFIDPQLHDREQAHGRRLLRLPRVVDLVALSTPAAPGVQSQAQIADQANAESRAAAEAAQAAATATGTPAPRKRCIGNLLLSSCPGKKVRLSGPVRGRGAICRDLGLDLKRIRGLGVRAIVCCLDDEELGFLGAPWSEYEREADGLGLDVLRLPMAEGFAPTCVVQMDDAITSLIQDYTLQGKSILVHCRGGVGRAGLTACLWMLKLGLVGASPHLAHLDPMPRAAEVTLHDVVAIVADPWLPPERQPNRAAERRQGQVVLDTVERLIETIRRRRSPKAIETAEQVRFIVEFVMYLHRQDGLVRRYTQRAWLC
ncbi:hypothetical protein ACQY0O_004797 [Thecaphora frezii]